MKAAVLTVLLLLCVPTIVSAEPTPLKWPSHQDLARHLSDVSVYSAIGLDILHSWRAPDQKRAFGCQAKRMLATVAVSELTKRIVHRERPDGSDHFSFFSEHTAMSMASSGWRYEVGVPVAVGAGYLRMAAHRHYLTDVIVGAGVGLLATRICQ